jgi:hypothetical protein
MMDTILECLAPLEAIALGMLDDDDEHVRNTAARALRAASETRDLLRCGDMRAVATALDAGLQVGMLSREHDVRAAALIANIQRGLDTVDVMLELYPTHSIGTRQVAGGQKGAEARRAKSCLTDAIIDKAMAHVHASDQGVSWTRAAEIVAKEWGQLHPKGTISPKSICRRTSVKW